MEYTPAAVSSPHTSSTGEDIRYGVMIQPETVVPVKYAIFADMEQTKYTQICPKTMFRVTFSRFFCHTHGCLPPGWRWSNRS